MTKFITDFAIGSLYVFAAWFAAVAAFKWAAVAFALFTFAARRFIPDP